MADGGVIAAITAGDGDPREQGLVRLGTNQPLVDYLRSVWDRREYVLSVPVSEFRSQNLDTVLGSAWHVLNPLMQVGVYFFVFAIILKTDRGLDNFLTFLAVGVFTYHFTQRSAIKGARSIVSNESLIRSIGFPRVILPVSTVLSEGLAYLPAVVVMFMVALATGVRPSPFWALLLIVMVIQVVFNFGIAFITARLTTIFRDFENVLPFALRVVFYMSGILYEVENKIDSPRLRQVFNFNPVYAVTSLARHAVFGQPAPTILWFTAFFWAMVLFVAGFFFFKAGEKSYGRI
ncbi:MAG: ABC transporter permease [Acidimicrobiia bacterium]|nr:ABC transporter permease [Acidimicrobiia bacterium]